MMPHLISFPDNRLPSLVCPIMSAGMVFVRCGKNNCALWSTMEAEPKCALAALPAIAGELGEIGVDIDLIRSERTP